MGAAQFKDLPFESKTESFKKYLENTLPIKDSIVKLVDKSISEKTTLNNKNVFLEMFIKITKNFIVLNAYCYNKYDKQTILTEFKEYLNENLKITQTIEFLSN